MKMGSATKTRAARAASPQDVIPMANHETTVSKPASTFLVLQKSVRGVVTAFVASARPLGLAGVVVGLVWLALKIVDRFQLWMTAAGVLMVVMSVASAFQEVAKTGHQTAVQYDADEDDVEQCKLITIPTTDKQIAVTMHATAAAVTEVPVLATEKKKTHHKAASATAAAEKPARRNSSTIELGELTVVHCGTVIEIQGSRGFIIPHSLDNTAKPTKTPSTPKTRSFGRAAANKPSQATLTAAKLPLLIAFEISSVLAVLRHQIAVGQTVEFSFSGDESSPETVLAVNVTPVAAEQEIAKSRNALLTCKQAREESFARAMGELKMISPRNEPIKHHVDLIKYAEFLDDDDADLPLEQFI